MGLSGTTFVLLGLLVCAGAFVQRIAGFGLAVVAAPFVVTFAPQVMPAARIKGGSNGRIASTWSITCAIFAARPDRQAQTEGAT